MIAERYPELSSLSDDEKLSLATELFVDVVGEAGGNNGAIENLIEQRLTDFRKNPSAVRSWSDVKRAALRTREA